MRAARAKSFQIETSLAEKDITRKVASSRFGALSFYGLLVTIVLFAVPFGAVGLWHKSLLVFAVSVLGGFRVADGILKGRFRIAEPVLLLPFAGILGLAVIQIVPWPGLASPVSADPYETTAFILVFAGLLVACEILFFYTNSTRRLRFLVALVIAVGVGSALFGNIKELHLFTQSGLASDYPGHEQGFAQFINRNHFAVLMEMSLGLLLGILIKGDLSEKYRFLGWVLSGTMAFSIIAANSRGGIVSMAAVCVFAVFVHIITRDSPRNENGKRTGSVTAIGRLTLRKMVAAVGLCGVVLGLIIITVAFVGGDTVVTRIESIGNEFETESNTKVNRVRIWKATLDLIMDKPLFGRGFGGYAAAIPAFDSSNGNFSLQQAHNDYLEILANGGVAAFALFAVFGVLVTARIFKNLESPDTFRRSCCFGAAIGIFGVLVHSFVDFGLHIMINALIFLVLAVIAAASVGDATES